MKPCIAQVVLLMCVLRDVVSQGDRRLPPIGATIDQLIARSMGGLEGYVNISNQLVSPDSKVLAELDMYLTKDQYQLLYPSRRRRTKRKAVRSGVLRWPNGEVPYEFKHGAYSNADKYLVRVSMREWEKYTCLRFRKRQRESNYVFFQDDFGCNSQLGMVGGGQPLNLDRNGCRYKGLYLHEIGHAVGLVHEHQRPIRDKFIRINYGNVHPSLRQWFQKYPNQRINNFNISYEFSSVMHYGITAFSVDGRSKTIEAQPQYRAQEPEIGRVYSKELSFTDIATVNNMYQCNRHCSRSIRCRDGGYVDQNCRCVCPDGSSDCQEGKVPQYQFCRNEDKDWSCSVWAKQGECDRNPRYMKSKCARACGICSDAMAANKVVGDQCINAFPDDKCKGWRELGDCVANKAWMSQSCKRTCGVCAQNSNFTDSGCSNRQPDKKCDDWAIRGECTVNPRWMKKNCKKSCQYCNSGRGTTPRTPQATTTTSTSTTTETYRIPTTTTTEKPSTTTIAKTTDFQENTPWTTSTDRQTDTDHDFTTTTSKPLNSTLTFTTTTDSTTAVTSTTRIPRTTTPRPFTRTTSTRRPSTTTLYIPPTTRKPVLPTAPIVSVQVITSDSVRFRVKFRRDRSSPTLLHVKSFHRDIKAKDFHIEKRYDTPRDIEVEYTNLKPKSAYTFRFFAQSDAGSGQYTDETIVTKAKATVNRGNCRNNYPDDKCQKLETNWKFCKQHRAWMSRHCKETCGLCPVQRDEPVRRTGDPNCKDTSMYCRDWSRFGHCKRNASYMLKYCKAACKVCTPVA